MSFTQFILADNLITRYVLENPWPLVIILLLIAGAGTYLAIQRDDQKLLRLPLSFVIGAIAVFLAARFFTTPGEHAAAATRQFVQHAEEGRSSDMINMLAPNATLHVGRAGSSGLPLDDLERELQTLDGQHRIKSNQITQLDTADQGDYTVLVTLSCFTSTESSYGSVPSSWLLEWTRTANGVWQIRRLTALRIAGRTPSGSVLR